MSRLFDDASSQYMEVDSAPVTATPLTMAGWFNTDNAAAEQIIVSIVDASLGNQMFAIHARGSEAGDPVSAFTFGGGYRQALSTTGYTTGVWHHACGVFASPTSRAAYIDGGSKGTNTDSQTPSGIDRTSIGRLGDSSPGFYMSGYLADIAIWNAALTDAEVASLGEGFSPLLIRPQSLVMYLPLIREIQDVVGGLAFTNNGSTVADHIPKLYLPAAPHIITAPPVAPPAGVPTHMDYYRRRRVA